MSNPQTPDDAHAEQADDSVFEQRDWLQIILASIGDGVITADTLGRINYINPVAEKLTGWTLADAARQDVEQVFQAAFRVIVAEITCSLTPLTDAAGSRIATCRLTSRSKKPRNAERCWFRFAAVPLKATR